MESNEHEMTIETLKLKIENQAKIIKELTVENEELYHQYNHLIIRNGKMLKRIDDFQKIIDDLHIRNEELQLINSNMMQINDKIRKRNDLSQTMNESSERLKPVNQNESINQKIESEFNLNELYERWKNFPGQIAHNGPNLRKQVLMLVHLYNSTSLRAAELFNLTGIGGVTGARYISTLKKFDLILFTGARKKGHYKITQKGISFIEDTSSSNTNPSPEKNHDYVPEIKTGSTLNFKKEIQIIQDDHNDL